MEITKEQREAWEDNPETMEWESVVGPLYKDTHGTANIQKLYELAELNGLHELDKRYGHLNAGQIAMNVRNRLRPIWRAGNLKTK